MVIRHLWKPEQGRERICELTVFPIKLGHVVYSRPEIALEYSLLFAILFGGKYLHDFPKEKTREGGTSKRSWYLRTVMSFPGEIFLRKYQRAPKAASPQDEYKNP